MHRLFTITAVLLGGGCLWAGLALAQDGPPSVTLGSGATRWPTERVKLVDGRQYDGLIESVDDAWVHLFQIRRPSGRPMFLVIRPIERRLIASVERLEPGSREKLREHVDRFVNRSRIEAARTKAIELNLVENHGTYYQRYRGKWFDMETTLDEASTRRAIVRTEQIFTGYRQILPPRLESRRPLRLVVLDSMDEYQAYLSRLGIRINGPACFIPADNLVVVGSDVARFAAQLAEVDARHNRIRTELETLQQRLPERLAEVGRKLKQDGTPRSETIKLLLIARRKFESRIEEQQKELLCCDRENKRVFEDATGQMFKWLYHEAFHAYLENYVFPSDAYDVPRWLNEGLAVVFEAGLLEGETLRVDAPNREALRLLQADLRSEQPLSLRQLLEADEAAFLAAGSANRHYCYCWGLVYYLTYEKHLLGDASLSPFVRLSAADAAPPERFEQLVGTSTEEFEREWRKYVLELK